MNKYKILNKQVLNYKVSIIKAISVLEKNNFHTIFIENNKKLVGSFSMGDFRKAVLRGIDIKSPLHYIINKKYKSVKNNKNKFQLIKNIFKKYKKINDLPILDKKGQIIKIISREKFANKNSSNLDLVIMAGGLGLRMLDLTKKIPKPLLPIDNQTLLSKVIMNFQKISKLDVIYISTNYKKKLIRDYIKKNFKDKKINIFSEKKPMGTIGSLTLVKSKIKNNFLVSNCDVLVDTDFNDALEFHIENKNSITIFATIRNTILPYGVITPNKKGELKEMNEKPDIQSLINCGVYLFNKKVIKEIPQNSFFDINHLISKLIQKKYKVMIYPIPQNNWIDFGTYQNYLKYI